jgi:ubiquinone/menaquinone biosynthesis C-methylase UbiE
MPNHQEKKFEYVLKVGKQAAANLDLQHEIFKKDTFAQLKKAGLKKDMVVWDVACGSGIMTEYLSEQVGPQGTVYAIDIREEQLQITKNRIEKAGHTNVEFILEDINNLDIRKYKQADIIHSSFLLMHLAQPQKAIEIMASLLKPGGVLSMHESSFGSAGKNCGADVENLYRLFVQYGKTKGFDYDIGRKIATFCKDLGIFKEVHSIEKGYETTEAMKNLITSRIEEAGDSLINSNLITAEEYAELKANLTLFLKSEKSNQCDFTKQQNYILAYR